MNTIPQIEYKAADSTSMDRTETYGVEWWSNPDNRDEGYITWYLDGKETWRITAETVGGDSSIDMGPRLISEEPMVSGTAGEQSAVR